MERPICGAARARQSWEADQAGRLLGQRLRQGLRPAKSDIRLYVDAYSAPLGPAKAPTAACTGARGQCASEEPGCSER